MLGGEFLEAIQESPDMEVAGIMELSQVIETIKKEAKNIPIVYVDDVKKLGKIDVAILAVGSRVVPEIAPIYIKRGINTVDAMIYMAIP